MIEPRNNRAGRAAHGLAVTIIRRLQTFTQWWVRLNKPRTQKFGYSLIKRECASSTVNAFLAHANTSLALHQLLLPGADHRRMNPEIQRQFARLSSSDSTAIATRALKAVLRWFLFTPTSHALWTSQPSGRGWTMLISAAYWPLLEMPLRGVPAEQTLRRQTRTSRRLGSKSARCR